jgi:hypothetical protein
MTTDPQTQPEPGAQPAVGARRSRRSRLRERSLLLNPAPVVAAALAAFSLALGGLTAQLITGHDPALGTLASVSQPAGKGTAPLTTSASGAVRGASAAPAGHATTAPLVTSTSGSAATGGTSSGRGDA